MSGGFDRSKELMKKTLGKMDDLIGKASTSMTTYVLLFVIVLAALMVKFVVL